MIGPLLYHDNLLKSINENDKEGQFEICQIGRQKTK